LSIANFFQQLTGGAVDKDVTLSATSPYTESTPVKDKGLFGGNLIKYIFIGIILYAAFVYLTKDSSSRTRKSSSVESMSETSQYDRENMSNMSQSQSQSLSQTQSQSRSQSEDFLFEMNSDDTDFKQLKRHFAPETHLTKDFLHKIINKLRKEKLNRPARKFLQYLRAHLHENKADISSKTYNLYALIAIVLHKISKCKEIETIEEMMKRVDRVPKVKFEHLHVKKDLLLEVATKRIEHLKEKRHYHRVMEKITTHAKFVAQSHDLNVLVNFLRDHANNVDELKKMNKYLKDLKHNEFDKKFLVNVSVSKDDIKYVINSRITQRDDNRSELLMKKLKALVHMYEGKNINEIRHLYKQLKDRDVKVSKLSSILKDIDNMSSGKFESTFTNAINFSHQGVLKALQSKIEKLENLRKHSKNSSYSMSR